MGVSTDAILFYGFEIDENFEWPKGFVDEDEKWPDLDEFLLFQDDFPGYPENATSTERGKYFEYRAKTLKRLKFDCPVEIDYHCSSDYPIWFIAAKGSIIRANRGWSQTFKPNVDLIPINSPDYRIELWCKNNGIPFKELKWHLASCWN